MVLVRKRDVLLFALCLVTAVAIAVGVQRAAGAPAATHAKVTAREWASQLSVTPLPGSPGVSRRIEVWGGREQASDSRLSGRFKARFDVWEYRDGRAHFRNGIFTLTNARGQWTGTFFGSGALMEATTCSVG